MKRLRLDKILADMGIASRRDLKELIRSGRVAVNGAAARRPEEKFDPETDRIALDGMPLAYREFVYLMLNKPAGLISATEDPRERTVLELLPENLRRMGLFPAGRLDKDAEGLLLLTNDGAAAHSLTAPRRHVDKVYLVRTDDTFTLEDSRAFAAGMVLKDGFRCMPAGLEILPDTGGKEALITVREGKFHQVKRMALARGKTVLYLKRLSMGALTLDPALELGRYRELNAGEREWVTALKTEPRSD